MRNRRVPLTEVVEHDPHTDLAQITQHCLGLAIANQHALGQLELQLARRQTGIRQRAVDQLNEVTARKFLLRKIDCNRRRLLVFLEPGGCLRTGREQHPLTDRKDQPGRLGERQHFTERHAAPQGMYPAEQRLETNDLAGGEIDARQVMQLELLLLDRPAQFVLDVQPFLRPELHRAGKELAPFGAEHLGFIERDAGILQQHLCAVAVQRVRCDADTRRNLELMPLDRDRFGKCLLHPAGDGADVLAGLDVGEH